MPSGRGRRVLRIAVWVFAVLLVVVSIGVTATVGWRPVIGPRKRALTARTFQSTPERLARGTYLVNAVGGCFNCHSKLANKAGPGVAPEFRTQGGGN